MEYVRKIIKITSPAASLPASLLFPSSTVLCVEIQDYKGHY